MAMLGLGERGIRLLEAFRALGDVEVAAGYSRTQQEGRALKAELNLPVYADWHDMLMSVRPDAVVVAVPPSVLHDVAVKAFKLAPTFYLAPPPTMKHTAGLRLIDLAKTTGVRAYVGQWEQHAENTAAVLDLLREGKGETVVQAGAALGALAALGPAEARRSLFPVITTTLNIIYAAGYRVKFGGGEMVEGELRLRFYSEERGAFTLALAEKFETSAFVLHKGEKNESIAESRQALQRDALNFTRFVKGEAAPALTLEQAVELLVPAEKAVEEAVKLLKERKVG